jgi:hypothetical protein
MQNTETPLRDAFWAAVPPLPDGLALDRREPIVVTRPGRGGTSVFDLVELTTPGGSVPLLAAYQERLLATHVGKLKERLTTLAVQRREKRAAEGLRPSPDAVPTVITDVAKPSVIDACRHAGVAVVDRRGTLIVNAPPIFIHVEGKGVVERAWKGRLFSGKASRVVRFFLTTAAFEAVTVPRTAQVVASACDLSYVYAHGVLTKLEKHGFVERSTSHSGFRLKDPIGLLKAWIASGERTALATEGFYCPTTTRAALIGAAKKLKAATGEWPLFTLASALDPDEIHVAGLAHGVYWNGELDTIVDAFGLKRVTPHNFLVLRPDPLVWTSTGGILVADKTRSAPATDAEPSELRRVALAQVAVDCATLPGRGREQADFLLGVYAKKLPYRVDEP